MELIGTQDILRSGEWQQRVDSLAARNHVPGAQVGLLAVRSDGSLDRRVMVTGVTSLATGVPVTAETLFQYGSITKVWTATLIMQLVEEGRVDLDTRVVDVLEDFALADTGAAGRVSVRHLLDHTSGIDGDVFTDTGDGDDCVARYVDDLGTAVNITEPGEHHSYCNAGFVVAGRILEVLRGKPWDDVLAEHLFHPLGLSHVITRARDAPLFSTAVGHLKASAGSDEVTPTRTWMFPRSIGPAGLITGSLDSLLTFAAVHLGNGVGPDGTRLLGVDSIRAMQRSQVDLTSLSSTQLGWGLGWSVEKWGEQVCVTHGGATIGQIAALHIFPDQRLAIAILTNSRGGSGLITDLHAALGAELHLTPPSPRVDPSSDTVDLRHLVGTYESTALRWQISAGPSGNLSLTMTEKQTLTREPDPDPQLIRALGPDRFLVTHDAQRLEVSHVRLKDRDFLYFGRLLERTSVPSI